MHYFEVQTNMNEGYQCMLLWLKHAHLLCWLVQMVLEMDLCTAWVGNHSICIQHDVWLLGFPCDCQQSVNKMCDVIFICKQSVCTTSEELCKPCLMATMEEVWEYNRMLAHAGLSTVSYCPRNTCTSDTQTCVSSKFGHVMTTLCAVSCFGC